MSEQCPLSSGWEQTGGSILVGWRGSSRQLCGVLTKHWQLHIRVGANCSRTKTGDKWLCKLYAAAVKLVLDRAPVSLEGRQVGLPTTPGTGTANPPCLWVPKYLCCLDLWQTNLLNMSAFNGSHQLKCFCNKMGKEEQILSSWGLVHPAPHPQQVDKKGSVATEWMWTYVFLSSWRIGILGVVCWL